MITKIRNEGGNFYENQNDGRTRSACGNGNPASGTGVFQSYPDEATIRQDIQNGTAYLVELDGIVAACATIAFTPDENYTTMVSGQWLSDRPYAVIHRIAVDDKLKGRGIAGWILEQAEHLCRQRGVESLKIDTHQDNTSMRRLLEKQNYHYCGVIQLHRDLSLRVAYEKRLDKK